MLFKLTHDLLFQQRAPTNFLERQQPVTVSTLPIASAKEVFDLLHDDLLAIEHEFAREAVSDVTVITDISNYLIEGGGKRIRPSLLLLAAKALGYDGTSCIRLGSVVEMLHTATLVHDDIIDEADTRRGRPSSNTTWGNRSEERRVGKECMEGCRSRWSP